jgi:pimeloyl-ACP methyl ester carboxylesterase
VNTREHESLGGAESGRCHPDSHDALPAALAFHGAGGGAWQWAQWQRMWHAAGSTLSAADYGRIAAPPARAFADLIDRLQQRYARRVGGVVLGASFGGLIACALAAPLRARALVLINPLLPGDPGEEPRSHGPDVRAWGLASNVRGTVSAIPELSAVDALLCYRRWTDFDGALLAGSQRGVGSMPPACPVLIVSSENDRDIDPESLAARARAWRADFVRLPGSHVSPLLGRDWLLAFDCVSTWLGGLDRRRAMPCKLQSGFTAG